MKTFHVLGFSAAVTLQACTAKPVLTSTLPAAPAAIPYVSLAGVPIPALSAGTAGAAVALQKQEFERRLQGLEMPVQILPLPEAALGLRTATADSFEAGSAQLKLTALGAYAEIAEVMKIYPASVAHVLVYGDSGNFPEPDGSAISLRARRAASILDYLTRRGVPLTRLRTETRDTAAAGEQVELVLKPVIQGREAQAWTPPD